MSELNNIIEQQMSMQKEAADGALEEYLDNLGELDTKKHKLLSEKLEQDSAYVEKFQTALMEMSLLISAAMVVSQDVEFTKIQKKIIFEARQDDDFIQDMRLFYATTITAEELSKILTQEKERELYTDRLESFLNAYTQLRNITLPK